MKRGIFTSIFCSFFAVLMIFTFAGCSSAPKSYESDAGLSITLPNNFHEKEFMGITCYLQSQNSLFTAIKEPFSLLSSVGINQNSTLEEYANVVLSQNVLSSEISSKDGLTYFTYTRSPESIDTMTFYYFAVVLKGSDSFWLCQFACLTSKQAEYQQTFFDWAKTIVVK